MNEVARNSRGTTATFVHTALAAGVGVYGPCRKFHHSLKGGIHAKSAS